VADRGEVVAYADRHGAKAAAERYGLPSGTVRSWRHRGRQRAARAAKRREADLAEQLGRVVELMDAGACLHCAGKGEVAVPVVERGGLVIRRARRLPCPTCGGIPRRVQVIEWPRREWEAAMARAGDLGAGWTAAEWARIRSGEVRPLGWRWTHHDELEPEASDSGWRPYRSLFDQARDAREGRR
jgi:hypothetical protein